MQFKVRVRKREKKHENFSIKISNSKIKSSKIRKLVIQTDNKTPKIN